MRRKQVSVRIDIEAQRKAKSAQIAWELAQEIRGVVVRHYGALYSAAHDLLIVGSTLIRPILSPFDFAPSVEEIAALGNRSEGQVADAISAFQKYRPSWIYTAFRLSSKEFQVGRPGLDGQPGPLTNSIPYGREALRNLLNELPSEHHSIPLVQQWQKLNKEFLQARRIRQSRTRYKDFLQDFRSWYFLKHIRNLRPDKPIMQKPHRTLELYRLTADGLKGAQSLVYACCKDKMGAAPTSNDVCKKCYNLFGMLCQSISEIPKT